MCARLALSDEQRQLVDKLVVNHLVMNHLAQRRDITDPKVIADFAERVGSVPALDHLYLLTYADTSAVGPDVWTVWKASLLADLYRRTLDYLLRRGAETTLSRAELQQRLRPLVLESLGEGYAPENVERFLATMPVKYLVVTPPETIAKHIRLTQPQLTAPVVLDVEHNTAVGFTTVTFCLRERRGVFAMIAGALSKNRLNILGAQIYTSEEGLAIDTLQVETLSRTPVTDAHVWRQVQADLVAALAAPGTWPEVPTLRRLPSYERKLQAFAQPPQVTIDNACSDSYTVIEVQAQDQLGLLYKLTRLLYESGLDVALAKISTEANRAIDVFYVTDAARKKIVDEATLARLKETLLAALT
ncbi:MAG: hypothetical protein KatS3mg131_2885 [Candidatus Tectimicrobiota bacterium]|nr:MAG: hypothetical protein KatS3mg131_2885 [Candidatus Tectomicrobia bacterium]